MSSSANKLLLKYWIVLCVNFFFSLSSHSHWSEMFLITSKEWNGKDDINRWSLEGERLNKRWKVKKSGGVKSIEKIENDRKDLSFSWPSGKIKNNPSFERCWKSHKGSPRCITVQNSPPPLLRYNSISLCLVLKVLFGGPEENEAYLSASVSVTSFEMVYIWRSSKLRHGTFSHQQAGTDNPLSLWKKKKKTDICLLLKKRLNDFYWASTERWFSDMKWGKKILQL